MPAKGPVSIFWQIIFVVFVPIADLWAFYRIKRLQKYLLYVYVPQIVVAIIIVGLIFNMVFEENGLEKLEEFSEGLESDVFFMVSTTALGLGFTIFAIFLIATWSEQWNKQFK